MKISKDCKIELVASKDATRFALVNPYLDGNQLVATDGKRLVAIPVELDVHDTNGPVECEVLKQSRQIGVSLVEYIYKVFSSIMVKS